MPSNRLHLSVVGFACISAFVSALIYAQLVKSYDINIISYSYSFVFPIGAFLVGLAGASGSIPACIYFNIKPSKYDIFVLVFVGALTLFLIFYAIFTIFAYDGKWPTDIASFLLFLKFVATKSHVNMTTPGGMRELGEAGIFGYLLLLFKFIGASLGGASAAMVISFFPMCNKCNAYYKKIASKDSTVMSNKHAMEIYSNLKLGDLEVCKRAILGNYFDDFNETTDQNRKLNFKLMHCPKCKDEHVMVKVYQRNNKKRFQRRNWIEDRTHRVSLKVPIGESLYGDFKTFTGRS